MGTNQLEIMVRQAHHENPEPAEGIILSLSKDARLTMSIQCFTDIHHSDALGPQRERQEIFRRGVRNRPRPQLPDSLAPFVVNQISRE